MHTLTDQDLQREPEKLLADVRRGELSMVTAQGVPLMLAVPLVNGSPSQAALVDIATMLYDHGEISLGRAARIAGMAYSDMLDELGRRDIATIRLAPGELERELANFSG